MNPNASPWTPSLSAKEFMPSSFNPTARESVPTPTFSPFAAEFLPSPTHSVTTHDDHPPDDPAVALDEDAAYDPTYDSTHGPIYDEYDPTYDPTYDQTHHPTYDPVFDATHIDTTFDDDDDTTWPSPDDDSVLDEDMSPLQMLLSVFTDLDAEYLERVLERCDFDVDAALGFLLERSKHRRVDEGEASREKEEAVATRRQVCRYFLEGECRRKDCWFSHDVDARVCKYCRINSSPSNLHINHRLKGTCLKGSDCPFLHDIDLSAVAEKVSNLTLSSPSSPSISLPGADAYPELPTRKPGAVITAAPRKPVALTLPAFPFIMGPAAASIPADLPPAPTRPAPPSHPISPKDEDEFPSLSTALQQKKNPKQKKGTAFPPYYPPTNFATIAATPAKLTPSTPTPRSRNSTPARILAHLQRPISVPWLTTGSALNRSYLRERAQAINLGTQRNRLFQRATAAYLRGDGAAARALSLEARRLNTLMRSTHAEASKRIFAARNSEGAFVDLHGLHVDEAVSVLGERLEMLAGEGFRGVVYVVTGTGHHSGALGIGSSKAKLRPAIEAWLEEGGWRFAETSVVGDTKGGVFAVEVGSG
ncbi:hypothetical protein BC936DRAFT_143257 [Jimgerdemannia flammicorona]|uniref:Smr domain-containing protein n=1 Tax=Jimgerdemannia flammicorona TaxID=994334 RepID=A0A433DE66_9FUNG|nr:hypothetical protein BC936DRAFT_143257 [Jimgerdemannia flammicorona]